MISPRTYLEKIIRMRKGMMRNNASHLNHFKCWMAIKAIEPWLQAYPKATDHQIINFMKRKKEAILYLLPGKKSSAHEKLMREFKQILNSTTYDMSQFERKTVTREICGQYYRVEFTVTENGLTIQSLKPATDDIRDIMNVVDPDILKQIHEKLCHEHLNRVA